MSTDLLLTLGHGSSAIAIVDGVITSGYEEERLTGEKSTSKFPVNAIKRCKFRHYDTIFVSHWNPLAWLPSMEPKHWRLDLLPPHRNLVTVDRDFTHHDCHAYSALAFANPSYHAYTIVADGFGNFGETISIYGPDMQLLQRARGYLTSVGLMYQYAATSLGLKPNQDEFKLLGYEAQLCIEERAKCEGHITKIVETMLSRILSVRVGEDDDPLFDIASLVKVQDYWHNEFSRYFGSKPHVAYVAQAVLERVILYLVDLHHMTHVRLAGGSFMNVKLTMMIEQAVRGNVCTMPLSGDQGAALGLYKRANPKWHMPANLYWGVRNIDPFEAYNTRFFKNKLGISSAIRELLQQDKIINVVSGDMEFGPRALCNTSTIALPTSENVAYINMINGRNTIMPMGPVVSMDAFLEHFTPCGSMLSCYYMATAVKYNKYMVDDIMGVVHPWMEEESFTGRPQILTDLTHIVYDAVQFYGVLINTSFNIHGHPIVFEKRSILEAIEYQQANDVDNRVHTLILER